SNGTLIAFLQQLRYGYVKRSRTPFIHSIALVGMRNIRDYKGKIREDRETLGTASPFNIVKRALTLHNFTPDEMTRLYRQHTEKTGQVFPPNVVDAIFEVTQGQPWLVNAIACEIVEEILHDDTTLPILPEYVIQAVETIIQQRGPHIDSLMERLTEERVRRIVEPVILGNVERYDLLDDDYRFVLDLGLLREDHRQLKPANRIYGEIMIRTLN
ncbi:MAG: ATP-binding protein, partial [Gammaproteobacteria bacterium]|nr:ATP-binding protein [Gammaproteobacteria bacterium]